PAHGRDAPRAGARDRAGLSVLRHHHHGPRDRVGAVAGGPPRRRRPVAARLAECARRRFAGAGQPEVSHHWLADQRPGRRGHQRGDRTARVHPRAGRRSHRPGGVRQPRAVRDAVQAPSRMSSDLFTARYSKRLLAGTTGSVRGAGYNESRLANAIDQLHDYLAVVGLVALLLGGIGVASGVHAFVMRKIDATAILRCLGATSWQVLAIYASQAAVMAFIGAAIGVL